MLSEGKLVGVPVKKESSHLDSRGVSINRLFIFNDEFQEELATIFKNSTAGNSPVPPAQIALAIILQAYLGIFDDEVIEEMSRG
jgi:hypothetical protein